MRFSAGDLRSHRRGLILAGGDGKRLLPLTRRIAGDDRPKQSCPVAGSETLLRQTRRRVSRLVQPWRTSVYRVSRFWEKPHGTLAAELMERGCLWNSFVMVGHVRAFLNLIRQALPCLIEAFESNRTWLFTAYEKTALNELYSSIGTTSFSQDVLSVRPTDLSVLRATGLGWSDLGEPGRMCSVLERTGVETKWGFKHGREDGQILVHKKAAGQVRMLGALSLGPVGKMIEFIAVQILEGEKTQCATIH